jgi:NADH:ubiquinone oxidoreductase subunit 4 (subunit M)
VGHFCRIGSEPDGRCAGCRWWSPCDGFLVTIPLWQGFDPAKAGMQFVEQAALDHALRHRSTLLGIDGISMPLILLTTFTTVLVVLAGWVVIKDRLSLSTWAPS